MEPYFSIIVVSLNAGSLIKKTIQSVLIQEFNDYEIIVKDGLSSDDTLTQIPLDERIRVYSQKDSGIYDAMNQAIDYTRGRYLYFLNCGDTLNDGKVLGAIHSLALETGSEVLYGDYILYENYTRQPATLNNFYLFRRTLCHQAVFFQSSLFRDYGNYNTDLKICADYEFIVKIFKEGASFSHISLAICDYMGGGVSESQKGTELKKIEVKQVKRRYFSRRDRFKLGLLMFFTFRPLRTWLASNSSPLILRKAYNKISNKINGGRR